MVRLSVILDAVSIFYDLEPRAVMEKTRKKPQLDARQMFHYLARKINYGVISVKDIGSFNPYDEGWDHATVVHSTNSIKSQLEVYPDMRERVEKILKLIEDVKLQNSGRITITQKCTTQQAKLNLIEVIVSSETTDQLLIRVEHALKKLANYSLIN